MKFGLKDETIEHVHDVFSRFPQIEEVIIYGSRAKGTYRNGSDIDLTISWIGLNLEVINRLSLELDDLLLPYTFDLSIYQQISNPDLIEHIQRVGVVFYKKQVTQ